MGTVQTTWRDRAVTVVSADGTPVGPLPLGEDLSGAIETGGTAQVLAAANPDRLGLRVLNSSETEVLWISEFGPADEGVGFPVPALGSYSAMTQRELSVWGNTTEQPFVAVEW